MHYAQRIPNQDVWSITYDGHTVAEVLLLHPQWSLARIVERIRVEGGFMDESFVIHRGKASVALSPYPSR